MRGKGKGSEGNAVSSSPLPLSLPFFFFYSRSNFRAIPRLETLATQANKTQTQVTNMMKQRMLQKKLSCLFAVPSSLTLVKPITSMSTATERLSMRCTLLYLSVNAFSTWVLIGDTIFTSPTGDWMDRYFTWSPEPREGLATCSAKGVPSFLSYF